MGPKLLAPTMRRRPTLRQWRAASMRSVSSKLAVLRCGGRSQRSFQPLLERRSHLGPLVVDHRVVGGVPRRAMLENHVLAQDSLERGAQRLQSPSRALVTRVGLELDPSTANPLKRVCQQKQLGLDVGAGSPNAASEPGPPDLDAKMLEPDLQEARRPDRGTGLRREDREWDLMTLVGSLNRALQPPAHDLTRAMEIDRHPAEQIPVGRGLDQPLLVVGRERFEYDQPSR